MATFDTCISLISQKHQNYTNKNGDHDANICNTIFIGHDKKLLYFILSTVVLKYRICKKYVYLFARCIVHRDFLSGPLRCVYHGTCK